MRITKRQLFLIGIPAICGALSLSCSDSTATNTASSVHIGVPPVELHFAEPTYHQYPGGLEAMLRYDVEGKQYSLKWRHDSGAFALQSIALSYYPTAARFLEPGDVCVAGKQRLGATTVEIFGIVPPTVTVDATTGETSLGLQAITKIDNVFDERATGKDMVRLMFPSFDTPSIVFVQFWDSLDLYSIDITSSTHSLVASTASQAGILHAPGLGRRYMLVRQYDHVAQGHLYVMSGVTDSDPILVFADADRDGAIDSEFELTAAQWESQGYQDAANYNF